MARVFRRKHTAHPIADLNVTNLIDLGFMLLIIFMSRSFSSVSGSTSDMPVRRLGLAT